MNKKVKVILTLAIVFIIPMGGIAQAEDYYCEVMTLNGLAEVTYAGEAVPQPLNQGDLLKEGDRITVAEGSYVDLAFDKGWNNVTRLAQNTQMQIRSIYPTGLGLTRGDIFARLEKLPKNSTFEIQTPTAVAAVRGSVYRTIHENDETRVLNYASSPVEVFGLDAEGNLLDKPVVLQGEQKTEVSSAGESPREPEKMTEEEIKEAGQLNEEVKEEIAAVEEEGRIGETQEIDLVEKNYQEDLGQRIQDKIAAESGSTETPIEAPDEIDQITSQSEQIVARVEKEISDKIESSNDRKQDESSNTGVGGGGTKSGSDQDRGTKLKNG